MKKVIEFFKKLFSFLVPVGAVLAGILVWIMYGEKIKSVIGKVTGDIIGDLFMKGKKDDEIVVITEDGNKLVQLPEGVKYENVEAVQYVGSKSEVIVELRHDPKNRRVTP